MAITRTSSFVNTAVERLYTDLILSTTTLANGWVQTLPGFQTEIALNRFFTEGDNLGVVQPKPATPVSASTQDERVLTLHDMQYYDEYNPREFNASQKFLWATGASADQETARALLDAITPSVADNAGNTLEKFIWQGDATTGIVGWIPGIDADVTVLNATPAGAITAANILTVLAEMLEIAYANNPAIIKKGAPSFFMNHVDAHFYQQATLGADFKGQNFNEEFIMQYQAIPIKSTHGIPAGRIFLTTAGSADNSNLKYGTWMDSDRNNVMIERTGPLDDTFGIKMTITGGTQHIYGKEIVEYTTV